jgi:polar amino acid transport system substrate-binding protein
MGKQWSDGRGRSALALTAMLCLCRPAMAAEAMHFVMEPFPPFVTDEKGKPEGPFPEVVLAVCASIKVQCKLSIFPWRRAYAMAEKGLVDGIFVLIRSSERDREFYFTAPVLQTAYGVFVRQDSKLVYAAPADLNGYTVAAYGPSGTSTALEEVARQVPNCRIEIEVDNSSVIRKLSAGRYGELSAAVINRDVGLYLLAREHVSGVRIAGEIKKIDYAIGLSRKKVPPAQAEQFNAALRELIRNGTVRTIVEKFKLRPAQ